MTLEDVIYLLESVERDNPIYEPVQDLVRLVSLETNVKLEIPPYTPGGLRLKSSHELLVMLKTRAKFRNEKRLPSNGMNESVENLGKLPGNIGVHLVHLDVGKRPCSVWFDSDGKVVACIIGGQ